MIAAVVAIGGGFVKYGEITTKLSQIEVKSSDVDFAPIEKQIDETKKRKMNLISKMLKKIKNLHNDVKTKTNQVNEKEIQLLKLTNTRNSD